MKEIRENQFKSEFSLLEKTVEECKNRLESAEKEAQDIINRASQRAEEIINDKQKEAKQLADGIKEGARKEADNLIQEAKNRAKEIEKEAHDKAKKEAKDRMKSEVERIEKEIAETKLLAEKQAVELKKEASEIVREAQESAHAKALLDSEAIILKAKERAKKLDEDSIARAEEADALIIELCKKTEDFYDVVKTKIKTDLTDLDTRLNNMRVKVEVKRVLDNDEVGTNDNKVGTNENSKTGDNSHLQGQRELNIVEPFDVDQLRKLRAALEQIPNVKIVGEGHSEEHSSISLSMAEPTPLLGILKGLSFVDSFNVKGTTIELKLKSNGNGDRKLIYK